MNKITLATLSSATAQEVFDQVANHLLTQNAKSITDGNCHYRSLDGLMCAAGCLIDDDEYTENMEGELWPSALKLTVKSTILRAHSKLIQSLQNLHDTRDVNNWRIGLVEIARKFKLSSKVPESYPEE